MKTYPDNPDATVQRESGVMFTHPELEPLFLEIDKRCHPPAQLVAAAFQLLQWAGEAHATRHPDAAPLRVTTAHLRRYLEDTLHTLGAAVEELEDRGWLDTEGP